MKNKLIAFCCFVFCAVFSGCSSVPVEKVNADFCGFVMDENNKPVEDVVIKILGSDFSEITTATNQSGMFLFSDVKTGNLNVTGYKNGYTEYKGDVQFYGRDKVFCIQLCSADFVLDNVEHSISIKDFAKARKQLNSIRCVDCEILRKVLQEYSKIIGEKKHEYRKA